MVERSDRTAGTARRARVSGVVLLLAAAVLWSLNGALIKLIDNNGHGPPPVTIAFYRSFFAGCFLLPFAWGKLHTLRPRQVGGRRWIRPAGLFCVVFFALMTVTFVTSNIQTKAANAVILQFTSTFWVFSLSPWLLHERPRVGEVRFLVLAILGIGIIFVGQAETDLLGLVNALASGIFFALLTMMIRQMRDSDSAAITVLNSLGSALLILPFAIGLGGMLLSSRSFILLVFMGVVQFGIPYYLYAVGLARVRAYQAALITMLEPVLVPVWTYLAVGEIVPRTTKIGGGVILLALALFVSSVQRSGPRNEASRDGLRVTEGDS